MKYDIYLMYIVLRLLGKITDFHVAAVRPSSCPPCPPASRHGLAHLRPIPSHKARRANVRPSLGLLRVSRTGVLNYPIPQVDDVICKALTSPTAKASSPS